MALTSCLRQLTGLLHRVELPDVEPFNMMGTIVNQIGRGVRGAGLALAAACIITGCGPNAFVDSRFDNSSRDPRENLRLTAVDARISSGGAELRRVRGSLATMDEELGVLQLNNVLVDSFSSSGTVEGITQAGAALAYLKDESVVPASVPSQTTSSSVGILSRHSRNDLVFTSGVVHRILSAAGSTDSLILSTTRLQWEQADRLFRAPGDFDLWVSGGEQSSHKPDSAGMAPPAVRMRGGAFVATAAMDRWNVLGGTMASGEGKASALLEERQKLLAEFSTIQEPNPSITQPAAPVPDPELPLEDSATTSSKPATPVPTPAVPPSSP